MSFSVPRFFMISLEIKRCLRASRMPQTASRKVGCLPQDIRYA